MSKIGRNDPCPCGSGKKYKACCGVTGSVSMQQSIHAPVPGMMAQALHLCQIGMLREAEVLYRDVLTMHPTNADALNNLGLIAVQSGRLEEAHDDFQRAIKVNPNQALFHLNLGNVLQDLRRIDDARRAFRRCIELKPDLHEAYNNLAILLHKEGHLLEAVALLKTALKHKPDFPEALNNLGTLYKDLGELDEAAACFRRAVQLKPDYDAAHSNLLFALNYAPGLSLDDVYREHLQFGRHFAAQPRPNKVPLAARKLKIGYVSGDFRQHTVAYFIEPVLAHHDRDRFEIICYCNNAADEVTARLQRYVDGWRDIQFMNAQQAAQKIRADGIDILIDLAGHTAHNRLDVFALRPAALQLSWLGYFNTTGLQSIDYLVSDPVSSPPDDLQRFSETMLRLPHVRLCYQAPDYAPEPSALPALHNGTITFGSFNLLTKLNDEVIALWSQILMRIPHSRLLLKSRSFDESAMQTRFIEKFNRHGIARERLILRTHSPHADMLAEYADMDIALDPFPFNGGLTTCEALWQGVPVLALRGEALIGRQSASFLAALGMDDWIAESKQDYIDRAIEHASNFAVLAKVRAALREKMRCSPICDARGFTRDLETLLMSVY
ncbi:MAG TPA: tetratricopeptide repeat protein [Burkholderiaceae bacterium]|jgi:predicted O-linked N-acetylglucosamine transferase (SPINDLY family)